jgi:hypothetical protein
MPPSDHTESGDSCSLRAGLCLLNQQRLVTIEGEGRDFRRLVMREAYGSNTLLLTTTEDLFEILEEKIRAEMGEGELITYHFEYKTSAQQPYNKMGMTCLLERIEAMVEFAEQNSHILEDYRIGTVVIGAVESFIQTSSIDTSGAEFGLVMLYNAKTQCVVQGTSKGVPVEGEYLQEARSGGFWDDEKDRGKMTYGEILRKIFHKAAQKEFGVDYDIAKDWHRVVCGVPRYRLLRDVVQNLSPIL